MRVALLHDDPGYVGGAELTMREFAQAAPAEVTLVSEDAETVIVGNCATSRPEIIGDLEGKRVWWFHNDLSPHVDRGLKSWLDENAEHIFCSPLQRDRYGRDGHLIPPALKLGRFKPTRQVRRNGSRRGMVSLGAWQNPGKGQQSLLEYATEHGEIDVYGDGPYAPRSGPLNFKGPLDYEQVPQTLWGYSTFVFLPWDIEPFGRCVVEAWAAGLELVLNGLVGARYWLERPEQLRTAAQDFWSLVA